MGVITRKVSDISGKEGSEQEFQTLVVRSHPAADSAKRLDVLPGELDGLKEVGDLVILEVRNNGETRELFVRHADFAKLVPDELVAKAPGTRGRPQGFRPNA